MSQEVTADPERAESTVSEDPPGIAGRSARFFIRSPLSPLFYVAMLLMGLLGLILTPRQEDPQISVPMIDIMVQYPGASAQQVANMAMQPLERIMSEIPGVKHVYSASERGQGFVTVEFDVGQPMGPSLVKVNDKLASNMDKIPPGVLPPLVKSKGVDDVPIVTLTLWSKDLDGDGTPDVDDGQLRLLAQDVLQAIGQVKNTGPGMIIGGRREQVTVDVLPARLSGYQISLDQVAQTLKTANAETSAGALESSGSHFTLTTGSFLKGVDDINRLVVGTFNKAPVYIRDVARVTLGPEDATQLVAYYTGPAAQRQDAPDGRPAVTIAVAKKELTNGVSVANAIIDRVDELKGNRIPNNVEVSITRNYGQTADQKVSELIGKLIKATFFVFVLVLVAFRALRPAIVVMLVIPVVLFMTVFAAWIWGMTIDRVSLFALIFSIGILVDDAIVVIENIYRRWLAEGRTDDATAVDAVREVGNPTILATFTVIAALLPMGFVSGMMGPYMAPIPKLGSVAMFISLFAAFVFTPYLAISKWLRPSLAYLAAAEHREHRHAEVTERVFRAILTPLILSPRKRRLFRLALWGAFLFTCSFFYFKWVAVKMMPLDNKPEFSVVIDLPEGTALPVTANLADRLAANLRTLPEVTALQVYVGTARPFDFNGMVRHYYLRSQPWQAEIQVQLTDKHVRARTSHEIAVAAREALDSLVKGTGATLAVVEMPPGPPVLQSVVAEIYGPTPELRRAFARDVTDYLRKTASARDVDNYLRAPYDYWRFDVDTEKAVRRGISVDTINRNLTMALGGAPIGDIKQAAGQQSGHESTAIVLQVPLAERSQIERLGDLPIQSSQGFSVPLRELGEFRYAQEEDMIYNKDLRGVEFVVADVGGRLAAPTYAMFQVQDLMAAADYTAPDGTKPAAGGGLGDAFYWLTPPPAADRLAVEWGGEWTVTFETFRDMGGAFMVALVLIYILLVWEFGHFRIPLVIMAPIPLTLLGIIPAHFVMFQLGLGGAFTATSMIGWIALAGIIVRNSILLVDFSLHEIRRGTPVAEAVIRACKVRTRPILITALALVAGSSVIITDPIFQGMAISLLAGTIVATVLTLIVIPLGCVARANEMCAVAAATALHLPASGLPCQSEVVPRGAVPGGTGAGGGWSAAPAKLWDVLTLVFYAIRGIFILLFDLAKNAFKPKSPPRSRSPKSGTAAPGGAPPATPAPAVAPPSALSAALQKVWGVLTLVFYGLRGILILLIDLAQNAFKPKPPPRVRRPTNRAPAAPAPDAGAGCAAAPVADGGAGDAVDSVSAPPAGPVAAVDVVTPPEPRSALVMRPAAAASEDTPAAQDARAPAGSPETTTEIGPGAAALTPAEPAGTAAKTGSGKKTAAKPATATTPSKVGTRSPRRGIRLKRDDEPDGDKS
ncbi:efflux RND transporter permease subunit [uncultured Thiodictyon sp.]|uniref:efflux RND transporter permease subunit n=1 Tax=uncultured Thiodictyon sp. TaxID=1846217 RepID=UPI0025F3FE31|nr:efflux RND transporter permease subunit [uncultured Thiodictyon sp.]